MKRMPFKFTVAIGAICAVALLAFWQPFTSSARGQDAGADAQTASATPVVVTATPTPASVLAAAALVARQTEQARTTGTVTPTPTNWVLATNTPNPRIVTATPTAENEATATVMAAMETAIALTTGTPDPNIVVVTNTPTSTATPTNTPTPTATATPTIVYITPTALPANVLAAATLAAERTAQAEANGTPTPLPSNWKVARVAVVPYKPPTANDATRTAIDAIGTAVALTTARPENVVIWTATPRPTAPPRATNTPAPTATATPTFVYVTPTALPANVLAAATLAAERTAQAAANGTPTPLPSNWRVARVAVVPYKPPTANDATRTAIDAIGTAVALTTARPENVVIWTATPIPTRTPAPVADAPPTATATPTIVYVTPTAYPANIFEAATRAAELTAQAESAGTATPLPGNWRVASVVVARETAPAMLTAIARTTALPEHIVVWTATPIPTRTPAPVADAPPMATATPTIVYITPTALPANVLAAATLAAERTAQAAANGTPTPLPGNWRVARVAIAPNPVDAANQATAVAVEAQGTAIALTTARPENVVIWTATPRPPQPARPRATPTPLFIDLADMTATPVPVTAPFPPELVGKILFLSDLRTGNPRQPDAYVMNPDGTGVARLTSRDFYDRAKQRDAYSVDKHFFAYSKREESGKQRIQVFYDNVDDGYAKQLTYFGSGVAWDAVWSPVEDLVAFVSNESGNDEIWVARPNQWPAEQLTHNDWEWDHSPSFSPDGSQIVFSSNRGAGRQQIWIMSANGNSQRPLVDLPFEAWGPVWVKYADQ